MAGSGDEGWEPPSRSLAYAYAAVLRDGESIGTAFLVDRNLALTCAHVAHYAATGRRDWRGAPKPPETFQLRFPQCHGRPIVDVKVVEWFPAADDDFALLRLPEGGVPGALVAPLSPDEREKDRIRILGFPKGAWYGVPLDGVVRGTGARLLAAIDEASLIGVAAGFSGAPVWSDRVSAVIGMLSTAAQDQPRLAAAIPMSSILPRLQSVTADQGLRSRVRMAFEAPRNEARCAAILARLEKTAPSVTWPEGWRPEFFDTVEVAEDGDLEIPWGSFWSIAHPLNRKFPTDGDLFFTVSLRPTGRRSPRNICEVAIVWSGRGVSFAFAGAVSQSEARNYLRQELQAHLQRERATGFLVQPSDWYGVEMAGVEFLDGEPDDAFVARLLDLMREMAGLFQGLLDAVEGDLGISLAAVRRRRGRKVVVSSAKSKTTAARKPKASPKSS